ncbi:MAG TPA: YbjQ family protein [Ktedonosporobacter sp.]|nr:YbjQ family protein [Ktedonosporobacter sp.]
MYQDPQAPPTPSQGPNIHNFVTTAMQLDGYRVARNFGIVRGIIVRSRSLVGNLGAAFQQIVGGDISIYTELCEKAREDAYERMIQHALQIGANAIIAVRYDATEISPGVTEVLCYGTAVVVEATAQ